MRELLPKGAMEEGKLPIFLTTWTDKTSPLCMFIHGHIRAWSVPHLKLGCWYLDCAKGFCPEDKEDLKKSIEIAGGTIDLTAAADVEDPQEDDLQHLDEKEKKEKEKEAERARKKKERHLFLRWISLSLHLHYLPVWHESVMLPMLDSQLRGYRLVLLLRSKTMSMRALLWMSSSTLAPF
jgi:hypothetical protein